MGRPPSNGGPAFRFNHGEVVEMDSILQAHGYTVPSREILEAIAQRFSNTAERSGKVEVSAKQVWNWFQNRRYAIRAKATKPPAPEQVYIPPIPRDDQAVARNLPQTPQPQPVSSSSDVKMMALPSLSCSSQSQCFDTELFSLHLINLQVHMHKILAGMPWITLRWSLKLNLREMVHGTTLPHSYLTDP